VYTFLSMLSNHYLAGLFDSCLVVLFNTSENFKAKCQVNGHGPLLSFIQKRYGGTVRIKPSGKGLTLSLPISSLYQIAETLEETPCALQSVYRLLLELKNVKASYVITEPLEEYRRKVANLVMKIKAVYNHLPVFVPAPDNFVEYTTARIEAGYGVSCKLLHDKYLQVGYALPSKVTTRENRVRAFGGKLTEFLSPFIPQMQFSRDFFTKMIEFETEKKGKDTKVLYEQANKTISNFYSNYSVITCKTKEQIEAETVAFREAKEKKKREALELARKQKEDAALAKIQAAENRKLEKQEREAAKVAARAEYLAAKQRLRDEKTQEVERLLLRGLKCCGKCGETKTLDSYAKNKADKTGHSRYCKICAHQEYYLPNKEEAAVKSRERYRQDPNRHKESRRKAKQTPKAKLRQNISRRIKEYIQTKHEVDKVRDIIACSPKGLVSHIQSKFTPEMNWSNYGTYWHMDHVIPCAAFDMQIKSHMHWCWHYLNLQPLTAEDNMKKNDALPDGISASTYICQGRLDEMNEVVGESLEKMGIATKAEYLDSFKSNERVKYICL